MMSGAMSGQRPKKGSKTPDPIDPMKDFKVEAIGQVQLWDVETGREIGTIKGGEALSSLKNWDSLAVVNYIATCNGLFGIVLEGDRVKACTTIEDLVTLVRAHVAD